ncbi:MAG: cell division protein SepF [Armatimonadetes bacterium]|nr:cell division protein SepF [Armatimonadota bacterium]
MYEARDEPEQEHGGIGTSFSKWWNNLRGRGADDDYAMETEDETDTSVSTATTPRSPIRATSGGGYDARMSGGSASYAQGTSARRGETIRIAAAREDSITVMPVTSFADIQKCADRLKSGEPQIVNLEHTPPEVAERLIDFLNGVTYALDGYVEKIADGAYLFTPAHILIQTDGPEATPKPFFDR